MQILWQQKKAKILFKHPFITTEKGTTCVVVPQDMHPRWICRYYESVAFPGILVELCWSFLARSQAFEYEISWKKKQVAGNSFLTENF